MPVDQSVAGGLSNVLVWRGYRVALKLFEILGSIDVAKEPRRSRKNCALAKAGETGVKRTNTAFESGGELRNDPRCEANTVPLPPTSDERHGNIGVGPPSSIDEHVDMASRELCEIAGHDEHLITGNGLGCVHQSAEGSNVGFGVEDVGNISNAPDFGVTPDNFHAAEMTHCIDDPNNQGLTFDEQRCLVGPHPATLAAGEHEHVNHRHRQLRSL